MVSVHVMYQYVNKPTWAYTPRVKREVWVLKIRLVAVQEFRISTVRNSSGSPFHFSGSIFRIRGTRH